MAPLSSVLVPERGSRPALWLALALVAMVYLVLWACLPPEVFWSPDEGAKLLQALAHRRGGANAETIVYGGRELDPELSFYPRLLHPSHPAALLSILYPQPTADGGVRTHWPPVFPLASLLPYRAFGARGLTLLPLAAGLVAAAAAGALGRAVAPTAAAPAVLAVGLASPMLFYSQLFWEHAPATALCLAGVVVLAPDGRPRTPRLAAGGALLAGAVVLRPESLLLVAVLPLTLAAIWQEEPHRRRGMGGRWWLAAAGAVVFAALAIGLSPGLRSAVVGWLQALPGRATSMLEFTGRASALLSPFPSRLAAAWFDLDVALGPPLPGILAWIGTIGVVTALAAIALGEPRRGWAVAAGGGLVLVPSWWALVSPEPYRAIHALILPAPYLALIALVLRPPPAARQLPAVYLGITTALYLVFGTLLTMTKMVGGLEWGNRYLLPLVALGAAAAATGAVAYWQGDGERRPRLAVVLVTVACLATGALFQARGARELLISKRALDACRTEVLDADVPVVTDLYWLPAAVAGVFAERPLFTLRDRGDLDRWLRRIGRRVECFRLITGHQEEGEVHRWLESVPEPSLELVAARPLPGLLIADVEVVDSADVGGEE